MMIEKDYLQKFRFNVVVARPKALFVKVYARVPNGSWSEVKRKFGRCIDEIPYGLLNEKGFRIVSLNLERLWRHHFPNEDFPTLKFKFYKGILFDDSLEVVPELKLEVSIEKSCLSFFDSSIRWSMPCPPPLIRWVVDFSLRGSWRTS